MSIGIYASLCLKERETLEISKYFMYYNTIDFIRRSHCTDEEVLQEYELVIV